MLIFSLYWFQNTALTTRGCDCTWAKFKTLTSFCSGIESFKTVISYCSGTKSEYIFKFIWGLLWISEHESAPMCNPTVLIKVNASSRAAYNQKRRKAGERTGDNRPKANDVKLKLASYILHRWKKLVRLVQRNTQGPYWSLVWTNWMILRNKA